MDSIEKALDDLYGNVDETITHLSGIERQLSDLADELVQLAWKIRTLKEEA